MEKNYLDKPCYKKNLNKGQKNLKEIFSGITFSIPNFLIVSLFITLNVLLITLT